MNSDSNNPLEGSQLLDEPPLINDLPPPPQRSQARPDFTKTTDAFLAALPALVNQLNELTHYLRELSQTVNSDRKTTESAKSEALVANNLTSQARDEAVALMGQYTERHQGAHAQAPTSRNDGESLLRGDFYFNKGDYLTYWWSGQEWVLYPNKSLVAPASHVAGTMYLYETGGGL